VSGRMNVRDARFLRACILIGAIGFTVGFGFGFVILAGLIPPPAPTWSARHVANFLNSDSFRAGTCVMMAAVPFAGIWGCAVAAVTRKTETGFPMVTAIQVAMCGVVVLTLAVFDLVWAVAAFRAGQIPPDTTRTLNDLAFFLFLFDWSPFCLWVASFSIAIFRDQNPEPIFPRWVAYLCLWIVGLSIPGCLIVFFKHGPFAFNGFVAFYFPVVTFFVWLVAITWTAQQALTKEISVAAAA
jgi:hypothetical protein